MNNDSDLAKFKNDSLLSTFEPTDYTDVGQGMLLSEAYHHRLRHCEGIGWMVYKDGVWHQSDTAAQGYSQNLTELQLQEAQERIERITDSRVKSCGKSNGDAYLNYALSRRSSAKIASALKEAKPHLHAEASMLDQNPLLLNTPIGEIDLKSGKIMPHDPEHLLTHITYCSPSCEGANIWNAFLEQLTCGDNTLKQFLQQLVGMASLGRVYEERLILALGTGGNGKSTFFNAIHDVLGDYACTIRAELLIASNDSGKKFEFANLRGRRFAVAEELDEGKQLDSAALKHLCSTGDINAQYKGKDIFTFKPSHSMVLCTNHMPAVKVTDTGTWDRLLVIPFNGRFRDTNNEIKNYGAYLVEHCGGAILQWIIEGAQQFINNEYKLIIPECISEATCGYREDNDWAVDFINECLLLNPELTASGNELYTAYEEYVKYKDDKKQPQNVVLPRIAQIPGVTKKRTRNGVVYTGVGIKDGNCIPESMYLLGVSSDEEPWGESERLFDFRNNSCKMPDVIDVYPVYGLNVTL